MEKASKIMDFTLLVRYKTQLLLGIALFVVALVLLTQYLSKGQTESLQARAQLQNSLTQLSNAKSEEIQPLLKQIDTLFRSHPSLKILFMGQVAETLLLKGEPTLLQPYSAPLLKRLDKEGLQDFYAFNQTTLLISEGKKEQALALAKEQKTTFKEELYAYTLLRIAFLEQSVAAWQELIQAGDKEPSVKELLTHIKVGPVTLEQYSHHHLQELQFAASSLPRS